MALSKSIVTRLKYQHNTLLELTNNLSEADIRQQIIPGKWSIFENIVHLQTYQHSFIERIKQVQIEDIPAFSRYTADADPFFHNNCLRTTDDILQDLITTRIIIAEYLLSLRKTELKRQGSHPLFGSMDVKHWLNFFLLHEAHHLFTIFKLIAEIKKISS